MNKNVTKKVLEKNSEWKTKLLLPHLKKGERILDFGCGDLTLAEALKKRMKNIKVSGVDVVPFDNVSGDIPFFLYSGEKLPFKNNQFDTVISFYVFHHCKSAEKAFGECLRVAKKRVILIESVPRTPLEIPIMRFLDWLFNIWKGEKIDLPFEFYSKDKWRQIFKKTHSKWKIHEVNKGLIKYLPIGGQYLFEVRKN